MSAFARPLADHPRLASYIATRDKRIAKLQPWSPTPLSDLFHELLARGTVKVGGRATCGPVSAPGTDTNNHEAIHGICAQGSPSTSSPCPGCLDTECNGECMENL